MEIGKGLNQWALVPLWSTIQKILHKHENVTNILKMKQRENQGIDPMGLCAPCANSFISNRKNIIT